MQPWSNPPKMLLGCEGVWKKGKMVLLEIAFNS